MAASAAPLSGRYADAPVARHRTWRHLNRWLAERVDRGLARIPQKDLSARLVSVVTLARWIAWQGLAPARPGRWRIAVIGAHELDTFDRGHWYALLPALLGSDALVEITFIGPKLALGRSRFPAVGLPAARAPEVHACPVTLREHWQSLAAEPPDLAMLFQPGFETNDGWFEGAGLGELVRSGIPVGACSYGRDEYVIDRTVLAARGYADAGDAVENPFYLEMGHPNIRWGHTLWRLGTAVPGAGFTPDTVRLEAVQRLSRLLAQLFDAGFKSEPLSFGTQTEAALPDRGRTQLVFLLGDLYVDAQTRQLLRLRGRQWQATGAEVPVDLLERRPQPAQDSLAGALWAAEVVDSLR